MLELVRNARPTAMLVATCVVLAGCSDDDPSGPGDDGFDAAAAQATANAAQAVVGPVVQDDALLSNLLEAQFAVFGDGFAMAALPMTVTADLARMGPVAMRQTGLSVPQRGPVIASEMYGSTLVYDPDAGSYVVDESATGAPATGVRVLYYAVDPSGGFAEPLNAIGYIDFVDASTSGVYRLEVDVRRTSGGAVTLADYFVQMTGNETGGAIDAEGFFGGDERIDFDLHLDGQITANGAVSNLRYIVENDARNAALDLEVNAVGDFDSRSEESAVEFTITHGSNVATFTFDQSWDGDAQAGVVDGALSYNGQQVVLVSGAADHPTFSKPGGGNLSAGELQALGEIWTWYAVTNLVAVYVLLPFLSLLAF